MSGLKLECKGGVWYATGTVAGQRIRKSLKTRDRGTAEEVRAQYEATLWKRHTYGEAAIRTFDEAALHYLEQGGEGRFLPPILKHFKGRAVGTITPAEIRAMALELYPKAAASTRNRQALIPARAVINHAHDLGWCGALKVKQFDVPKSKKHKPVSRAWIDAFMQEADRSKLPHLSALVLFMHQTGARISEAVRLEGRHLDLGQRIAMLERTKTDEWSPRFLTAELVTRIAGLEYDQDRPVFGYTDPKAANRRIKVVAARAYYDEGKTKPLEVRTSHSAGRHSFATNAVAAKLPIKDVMDAGGWKSAKLFMETYVHSLEAGRNVASAFDKESGPIGGKLTNPKPRHRASVRNSKGK